MFIVFLFNIAIFDLQGTNAVNLALMMALWIPFKLDMILVKWLNTIAILGLNLKEPIRALAKKMVHSSQDLLLADVIDITLENPLEHMVLDECLVHRAPKLTLRV